MDFRIVDQIRFSKSMTEIIPLRWMQDPIREPFDSSLRESTRNASSAYYVDYSRDPYDVCTYGERWRAANPENHKSHTIIEEECSVKEGGKMAGRR